MKGRAVAVDPGADTWKVLALKASKGGIAVTRFGAVAADEGAAGLNALGIPLAGAVAGLAGRYMTLRYTQVPPSPDWQLRQLMDLEIQELRTQSGGALSADYNLLPITGENAESEVVLLALARDEAIARINATLREARGSVRGIVPNCIGLYNAYVRTTPAADADEVVCLANFGHETIDLALVRGQSLLFARNLSGGCKVLDDAIARAFNVSARKADQLKRELLDLSPESRGRFASGQAEKVTMAAGGAANVFVAAVQSSLSFCRAQTKIDDLRLDKVLICGGGAKLRGLRGMLREALRCPVELFDPFGGVDLAGLPPAEAEALRDMHCEAAVALGLAISVVDPDVYALEILPESVKRRQRFQQRTAWNIAAAAVGVALLGIGAVQGRDALEGATQAERKLSVLRRSTEATHEQTAELVAQNAVDRAVVDVLTERALPLHGVLRALRAVRDTLPSELWITSFDIQRHGARAGRAGSGRPIVVVKGAGRAIGGVDVGAVYRDFSQRFREHELLRGIAQVTVPASGGPSPERTEFTLHVDFVPQPTEPAADKPND